jgi:hypothetical protein
MKKLWSLKPLHIYLIGVGLSLVSGVVVQPFSQGLHTAIVVLALLICIAGVVKYFRS